MPGPVCGPDKAGHACGHAVNAPIEPTGRAKPRARAVRRIAMAMYDGGQPAGQATPEEQSWLELVRASADREWRELPESLRQVAEWVAEYASLFYPYDDAQESNRRVH